MEQAEKSSLTKFPISFKNMFDTEEKTRIFEAEALKNLKKILGNNKKHFLEIVEKNTEKNIETFKKNIVLIYGSFDQNNLYYFFALKNLLKMSEFYFEDKEISENEKILFRFLIIEYTRIFLEKLPNREKDYAKKITEEKTDKLIKIFSFEETEWKKLMENKNQYEEMKLLNENKNLIIPLLKKFMAVFKPLLTEKSNFICYSSEILIVFMLFFLQSKDQSYLKSFLDKNFYNSNDFLDKDPNEEKQVENYKQKIILAYFEFDKNREKDTFILNKPTREEKKVEEIKDKNQLSPQTNEKSNINKTNENKQNQNSTGSNENISKGTETSVSHIEENNKNKNEMLKTKEDNDKISDKMNDLNELRDNLKSKEEKIDELDEVILEFEKLANEEGEGTKNSKIMNLFLQMAKTLKKENTEIKKENKEIKKENKEIKQRVQVLEENMIKIETIYNSIGLRDMFLNIKDYLLFDKGIMNSNYKNLKDLEKTHLDTLSTDKKESAELDFEIVDMCVVMKEFLNKIPHNKSENSQKKLIQIKEYKKQHNLSNFQSILLACDNTFSSFQECIQKMKDLNIFEEEEIKIFISELYHIANEQWKVKDNYDITNFFVINNESGGTIKFNKEKIYNLMDKMLKIYGRNPNFIKKAEEQRY